LPPVETGGKPAIFRQNGGHYWFFAKMHGKLHGLPKKVLYFSVIIAFCQNLVVFHCQNVVPSPIGGAMPISRAGGGKNYQSRLVIQATLTLTLSQRERG
jgi:hypothetical protein